MKTSCASVGGFLLTLLPSQKFAEGGLESPCKWVRNGCGFTVAKHLRICFCLIKSLLLAALQT